MFYFTSSQLIINKISLGGDITKTQDHQNSFFFGLRQNLSLFKFNIITIHLKKVISVIAMYIYYYKLIMLTHAHSGEHFSIFNDHFIKKYHSYFIFFNNRWSPGLLTNFKHKKRIYESYLYRLNKLKTRSIIYRRLCLLRFPQFLFLFSMRNDWGVLNEARIARVLNTGIFDGNVNPLIISWFVYRLPGNSSSSVSLKFYRNLVEMSLKLGMFQRVFIGKFLAMSEINSFFYKRYRLLL